MAQASQPAERLFALLQYIYGRNPFYTSKLDAARIDPSSLRFPGDLSKLPLTTKRELIADQQASPPWGTNLSEPLDTYTRYNQTSSTTGSPLRWLDTNDSWQWMPECWKTVYAGATVDERADDPVSVFVRAISWILDGLRGRLPDRCAMHSRGGMSSHVRLSMIETLQPTSSAARRPTRSIARRCRREARGKGESVRKFRARADRGGRSGRKHPGDARADREGWGARVIDHHGLTKSGRSASSAWRPPARCI